MVWNCSQQSSTVELAAPSEIEINWLREQCRTAFGEFNIEHCGLTWIVTALYEAQKRKGKTHLRISISPYVSRHQKCQQTFYILIAVKVREEGI